MAIKYFEAPDIKSRAESIAKQLGMNHIEFDKVAYMRSRGTSTSNIIARCHGLSKVMQMGMKTSAFYVIEVISERFDRMPEDEQTKTIIHELMHIPKSFGGGFRQHDFVKRKNVELLFKKLREIQRNNFF